MATFRFYEELNDFLPQQKCKTDFEVPIKDRRSVKDMIESLGVPHTEIDLILVNGHSVGFDYILEDKDRVSVYPVFESLNIGGATRLRPIPLRRSKFIADINLGNIAKYMRVLGFDVYYDTSLSKRDIISISKREQRIILTQDRKLLKFKDVTHGMFIRSGSTIEQIKQILIFLDIKDRVVPFSRCLQCNTHLNPVPKEKILDRIPAKTKQYCHEYAHCQPCDKIYWKGTHYLKMRKVVSQILE